MPLCLICYSYVTLGSDVTLPNGSHSIVFYSYFFNFHIDLTVVLQKTECTGIINICHNLEMNIGPSNSHVDSVYIYNHISNTSLQTELRFTGFYPLHEVTVKLNDQVCVRFQTISYATGFCWLRFGGSRKNIHSTPQYWLNLTYNSPMRQLYNAFPQCRSKDAVVNIKNRPLKSAVVNTSETYEHTFAFENESLQTNTFKGILIIDIRNVCPNYYGFMLSYAIVSRMVPNQQRCENNLVNDTRKYLKLSAMCGSLHFLNQGRWLITLTTYARRIIDMDISVRNLNINKKDNYHGIIKTTTVYQHNPYFSTMCGNSKGHVLEMHTVVTNTILLEHRSAHVQVLSYKVMVELLDFLHLGVDIIYEMTFF